jgi:hypothetical protein
MQDSLLMAFALFGEKKSLKWLYLSNSKPIIPQLVGEYFVG